MRLFIAINFSDEIKQKLVGIQSRLKENTLGGNFTAQENLHLTLVFLGEVDAGRIGVLHKIMDDLTVLPFRLRICGVGSFRRDGGDICWVGIDANKSLGELYHQLCGQLSLAGFQVEKRKFTPHLTLGREVRLHDDFDLAVFSRSISPIEPEVSKISLMKSERIKGRLTYTEIWCRKLSCEV